MNRLWNNFDCKNICVTGSTKKEEIKKTFEHSAGAEGLCQLQRKLVVPSDIL
jgi:hypothetical protein